MKLIHMKKTNRSWGDSSEGWSTGRYTVPQVPLGFLNTTGVFRGPCGNPVAFQSHYN